ncbi:hypothetical protein D9V86_05345 [Bacteroidetes/Chlorobi group bacterium ChocPot_Mid]|jgi:phosphate/sulfate permease|nr:MAG: hypothetical protein D9V86_05345 [Bacteroidetes/Chlorobi group bacterium ChocPot_Mid]
MNKYLRIMLGTLAGAILGYGYYYFIGCSSGTCPITSNWHISTVYGAVVGLALSFPSKKKAEKNNDDETKNQ